MYLILKFKCRLCRNGFMLKTIRIMKLVIVLLVATCLQVSAKNAYTQRVTLKENHISLQKVFNQIRKQTNVNFFYADEVLKNAKKISINVYDRSISDVLDLCFKNQDLSYTINENTIVIKKKEPEADLTIPVINAIDLKGRVTDEKGKPLADATILIKGTTIGTKSDADGSFTINVAADATLIVSFVGYETKETKVNNRTNITIQLTPSSTLNDQIVVVGYGTQKRSDITGAVASVPKSRLAEVPVTNILHAIEGSVAGLTVTQNSSVPGSSASVLIRGQNSINANSGPLIVVDGIPFSTTGGVTNDINPNDVASIEVLKDASAVAIYGTRGSQGVILITTKRGTSGKPVIRYNAYAGPEDIAHILEPRNAAEYLQKYADYWSQTQTSPLPSPVPNYSELVNYNAGKTTDWIKQTAQTGLISDNNLSISGGTPDVRYYVSGEYLKEKGVVKGYQYHRASLRSNIDVNITNYLTAGTSLFFAANNYDGGRANLLNATAMSPYGQVYDANGNYAIYPMYPELLYTNPLLGLYTDQLNRSKDLNGNVYAEVKLGGILQGLKYRINASYSYVPARTASYTGRDANNTIGSAALSNTENNTWVVENILSYNKDWAKNHIDFTGLYSSQQNDYFASGIAASGFVNDQLSYSNLGAGATVSAGSLPNSAPTNGSYQYQSNLVSQMGRINYSYNSRYLLTVTARRDGYSAFGANTDKFGLFPSVALGWNISNEHFMQPVNFVNNLKLRLSYGKTGNQAIGVNQTATLDNSVRYPFEGISTIGVVASTLGNANLHWESTEGFNAGIDFSVIKNRITGSIDVYHTRTSDILLKRNLPTITGYNSVWDNLGITANKGIEVTLNTKNINGRNFKWESLIAFSANQNKIVDLYGDKKSDIGNRWFIDHPISVIYDYKLLGVWQTGEDASKVDPGAKPGDLKFADINGDGKITPDKDKVILGQTAPKWIGSFTNTFNYKNWHLNIFIQTAQGMLKNNPDLNYVDESGRRNTPEEIGYWTPTNKNNTRPALSYTNTRGYGYPSDASYTRIKDVTLSYIFSGNILDKIKLGSLTLYVSGRNLYTFTKWIGWDPENDYSMRGSGNWTNNYPVVRSVVFGANISLR
jgi:TonB-linked SusC/RagA family outer membrane protein